MKLLLSILLLFIVGCSKNIPIEKNIETKYYSFNEVWRQINSDKQNKLSQDIVSYKKLFKGDIDVISQDAKRTLTTTNDILPYFNKLAHPNGICFKGTWNIDTKNIYSGHFEENTKSLIIVRASSAMSNTKSGQTRALGFAGKLFPSTNPTEVSKNPSANFFLIDDLGGTNTKYYKDITLLNEPPLSLTYSMIKNIRYSLKIANTFNNVDQNPTIRQLYEVSKLNESNFKDTITPKWMKLEIENKNNIKISKDIDFREELALKKMEKLVFNIYVANKNTKTSKNWTRIGNIILDESTISTSCDHRLHFHHPKFINNLRYGNK
jgi:hypothetical protein